MKRISEKRGPLRPPRDFRWMLAFLFFVVIPLGSGAAVAIIGWDETPWRARFFPLWLTYMPLMWGIIMGPVLGHRLAAAVGYHWSSMAGRLVELAVVAAAFAACVVAASYLHPKGWALPLLGAGIGVLIGIVEFIRALMWPR